MLAFRTGLGPLDLREVAPYLLVQARERPGQWEIRVHEARGDSYSVRYTEEEYSRLSRTMYHGLRNGTKLSAFHAGLENAAQTLWPTGSLDHVAMRHVGVAVVMRYVTKDTGMSRRYAATAASCLASAACLKHATAYRSPWSGLLATGCGALAVCAARGRAELPQLIRLGPEATKRGKSSKGTSTDAPQDAPGGGGADSAVGPSQTDAPGDTTQPPPAHDGGEPPTVEQTEQNTSDVERTPPMLETPATEDDAQNGAEASEDGRTIVRGDVVAVVGQNFNKEEPVNHVPIVGLMVGPCQDKPNVYAKTAANLEAAIEKRITEKAIKPDLSRDEMIRIGNVVRTAMSCDKRRGLFSKHRIQRWACQRFNLEECRSGKWSLQRFRNSLMNLYAKDRPKYRFQADLKLECMKEGKPPRMLIADGDEGQLMALAVVKCFEDLLFEHFESKSIKHLPKREAMDRVAKELTKAGAKAVEGDGTAWDTTCNVLIRSLAENPILRHIFEVLSEYGVIPSAWMEEHSLACEQKKLRLFFSNKFEQMSVTIDAIRRSGHRGTSCLNWWINFVMWTCSVFKQPERFLDPSVRRGEDLVGIMRWWNGCFEGDDSLCIMHPPMREGDKLSEVFLKFWKSAGFNMKIVFCSSRATFVGWHFGCTDGEINNYRCPELPRALANSGVSVSTEGIKAAKEANRTAANVLAAASALARASDFSGILPTVSNKYLEYAESVAGSNFQDREMSIRSFGEEGHSANDVRAMIRERNIGITPQDEMATLEALGCPATHDEVATFTEYVWSMDPHVLTDYAGFKASLPPSWRTA